MEAEHRRYQDDIIKMLVRGIVNKGRKSIQENGKYGRKERGRKLSSNTVADSLGAQK